VAEPEPRDMVRMAPRSAVWEAEGDLSLRQRRAARRARKQLLHAAAPKAARRFHPLKLLSWRAVSGLLVLGLSALLYLFLTIDAFFVSSVAIGGEKYIPREEVFRFSDIARRHIFWVDPVEVEARLESVPNIADATVLVGWPPDMVQILVVEREPALIWEQGVRVWVDVNGIVMMQREDRPGMLRIVVPNAEEPVSVGQRIPKTIVDGALQLRQRYPRVDVLLYDSRKGLGFHEADGWTVWFGAGDDMETKLLVYRAIVAEITDEVQPGEINVVDPDRPVYTQLWRKTS